MVFCSTNRIETPSFSLIFLAISICSTNCGASLEAHLADGTGQTHQGAADSAHLLLTARGVTCQRAAAFFKRE